MTGKTENLTPRHVAIIMDGNGRWAAKHGLRRFRGHEQGGESVRAVVRGCRKLGVEYLTLYAFSTENWIRPKREIDGLMNLLARFLDNSESELHENQIRLRVIGRMGQLPQYLQDKLTRVMAATAEHRVAHLTVALNYGGRAEIVDAATKIAERVKRGELDLETVDEDVFAAHLYAPDLPDPDLLIRTSGEMRVSNFLLWQISYSELYVTDVLWPDFREEELAKAVEAYGQRRRRYGDVG